MDNINRSNNESQYQIQREVSDAKEPECKVFNNKSLKKSDSQIISTDNAEMSTFDVDELIKPSLRNRDIKSINAEKGAFSDSAIDSDSQYDIDEKIDVLSDSGIEVNSQSDNSMDIGVLSDSNTEVSSPSDNNSSISEASGRRFNGAEGLKKLEGMADKILLPEETFQTAAFLSGQNNQQTLQVTKLCKAIKGEFYHESSKNIIDLLEHIKHKDSHNPKEATRHSFLLRCAILQLSEEEGLGLQSWQTFTHASPPEVTSNTFWPWLEQPKNWIPEAQGAAAKYMETTWIKALELAKKHPEQMVVAYKGGFGAGKTYHGTTKYGDNFAGSVSPDKAKKVIRKALPISHAAAHVHSSDLAFKLFDGLIKHPTMGTIIYDSSLSSVRDVKELIKKSEAAGKPLQIIDITRDDKARVLAVLARPVEGEDPRVPLHNILLGAERDRKERPACLNAILEEPGVTPKDGQKKTIVHNYELHCSDAEAADSQLICTLNSGQSPKWNDKLAPEEINDRLSRQGIKFNTNTERFEAISSTENWQNELMKLLKQPVKMLVKDLSSKESQVRERNFSQRILPLTKDIPILTPANLYESLAPKIRSVLSSESFIRSFTPLEYEEQQDVIKKFQQSHDIGIPVNYMDLPVVMAIELHKAFTQTPKLWGSD